jgi:hypothetical protein
MKGEEDGGSTTSLTEAPAASKFSFKIPPLS